MPEANGVGNFDFERETVRLDSLVPYPHNARQHNEENVETIAASLYHFGQVEPLVCQRRTRHILGGNGRLMAMKRLGWTQCQVVWVDLDDRKAAALSLALNRSAELARWDERILAGILADFRAAPLEEQPPAVGFTDEQVERILARYAPAGGQNDEPAPSPSGAQESEYQPQGREEHSGPQADDEADDEAPAGPSVHLVQLFLTAEAFPRFQATLETLMHRYHVSTPTDAILNALEELSRHLYAAR